MSAPCEHLLGVTFEDFVATECPDCVAQGSRWVHLRQCVECGYVGCCDSSPNTHASRHAADHPGHPTARSAEAGELWVWCYAHESGVKP
ncbi:MAG: UBP-type zinc finger domain-containing protein [Microthrixaceae bacterium]